MRKYALLAMTCALAACGGGSGGEWHGDYNPADGVPPALDIPNGAGTIPTWGNGVVKNMSIAARTADNEDLTFFLNGAGQITSINFDNREYKVQSDRNEFVNVTDGVARTLNLVNLGKEAGLTYADFGYIQETENHGYYIDRDVDVFVGGPGVYEHSGSNPKDATYTGVAAAYIQAETADGVVKNQISQTTDAKLVTNAIGTSTLTMNFSKAANPWYDVIYDGTKITLINTGNNVPAAFMVTADMKPDGGPTGGAPKWYGAPGDTSEVVWRVAQEWEDKTTGREVDMDAVFGGKRQPSE
ncbi:hypothetical protein HDR63_04460 [bacterium]|nr:hypothetical protein [bacterium]